MREYQAKVSGHIDDDETGTAFYISSTKSELYFCLGLDMKGAAQERFGH